MWQICRTGGLISEDRSTKATLLFTIPRSCLSRLHRIYLWKFQILIVAAPQRFFSASVHWDSGATDGPPYSCSPKITQRYLSLPSSTDSDLEAFSHNPTDGSFAPLPLQASANANCLNLRFLSYWAELLLQQHFISRVKLTCLTTV